MNEEKTFKEKLRTIISKIDLEKVTLEDFEKESYYNDVLPNFKKTRYFVNCLLIRKEPPITDGSFLDK